MGKTTKTTKSERHGKARNGTGHVRKRLDGRWEGQYYFKGERKSCYGTTEEDCRGKLNVILAKIYKGSYLEGSSMPLYTYLHYWHHEFLQVKPSTHTSYDTYIEGHVFGSKLGSIALKQLCLNDFNDFFKEKEVTGRLDGKPGGLSPKTLRNLRNMLSEALGFATNNLRWLEQNPILGLKTPKVTLAPIKVYSSNNQFAIEKAALEHNNVNALMVLIDLYTGLRIGELCGLFWSDFGSEKEFFEVNRIVERLKKMWADHRTDYKKIDLAGAKSNAQTALYFGSPKTESGRRKVYTSDQAVLAFEKVESYQKENGLYKPDGFVFLQQNGNPFEPRTYNDLYRDVIKRAGVDYRNFHTLRHTFATRAYELAFDIPTLAEILGHAQKSTTENMYGHSVDDTKKKAMAKFNQRAV